MNCSTQLTIDFILLKVPSFILLYQLRSYFVDGFNFLLEEKPFVGRTESRSQSHCGGGNVERKLNYSRNI